MTNHNVKYRNADYLIRLHLYNGNSTQNEVERIQGYIGDAICDGGSLEWEHRKLLEDITEEVLRI